MHDLPRPIVIRKKRRTISLQVRPDSSIVIYAPLWMPELFISRFVSDNKSWIIEKLRHFQQKNVVADNSSGEYMLYLGEKYPIVASNLLEISITKGQFLFPKSLTFRKKKEMNNWYVQQANTIITRQIVSLAKEMRCEYKSVSFSDTRSKWGSCTSDNHLQFNWRLVMAPLLVIRYVVTHELAHIEEKNHSQAFWAKVRKYNPSFKQSRKWLKEHGDLLFD